jgi:branched-chain amino acid transport system permease protein
VRWGLVVAGFIILLLLPSILGLYLSEVFDNVGLYLMMGLGLNIVVGFAGLLDLGYVAFFAIGAYTVGVLTSPELSTGIIHNWWIALPFAILVAFFAGVVLGIPVLKMRGDYLAIVTLGFGEIIHLLALSDWLKPYIGGAQGIQGIARPDIGNLFQTNWGPQAFYYLFLGGSILIIFIATRLRDSRLGRAWMAVREDEDVAQAMGINLVTTKLLAFAMGASFGGLSGAIFGSKLASVYPDSFKFLVSIYVLSLIIIGGMGSIPGVVVGALALVGIPELLREFGDFRYLLFGLALVVMMLTRPEGLWPSAARRRELHEEGPQAGALGEAAGVRSE